MANCNSTTHRPVVQNVDKPFSEIFELLTQFNDPQYKINQEEMTEAIHAHADNAVYVLINGIRSLGAMMSIAVDKADDAIPKKELVNIGWLTHLLGNLLEECFLYKENLPVLSNGKGRI